MVNIKNFIKKRSSLILTIIFSLIAFIIYGSLSFHDNIWYDEAYQLILNENSLVNIIKYVARDFHVPFYAVGLKIFTTIFGTSPLVGRMFSLMAIICAFILSFYKIRDLFSLKTSIIFSSFLLSLNCMYFCSIEIRPYSWPMFFTLASTVYMLSIIKYNDKKSWILYIIFSVLAMYSHNIALIYIFFNNLILGIYLFLKKRTLMRKYFLCYGIKLLLYLPWLSALKSQYSNLKSGFWITKPVLLTFINDFKELFSLNNVMIVLLIIIVIISVIYNIYKYRKGNYSYLLLISFFVTLIACYLISLYVVPLLIAKYITTFIGVLVLGLSGLIGKLDKRLLVIVVGLLIVNSFNIYNIEKDKISEEVLNKNIEYFANKEDLYFVHYTEFSLGELAYYFPNATHFFTDEIDSNLRDYDLYGDNVIKLDNINELDDMNIDNLWVSNLDFSDADDSLEYFKYWKKNEYYEYRNTYYRGKNFLVNLIKSDDKGFNRLNQK